MQQVIEIKEEQFLRSILITNDHYSREIQFFRNLILEGQFEEVQKFLFPFQEQYEEIYNQFVYHLKKQQFIELIVSQPDADQLINILKTIEKHTSPENYKNLFILLTLKDIRQHTEYKDWSVIQGRIKCFETIKKLIDQINNDELEVKGNQNYSAEKLLERLLYLEIKTNKKLNESNTNSIQKNLNEIVQFDHQDKFKLVLSNENNQTNSNQNEFNSNFSSVNHIDLYASLHFGISAKQQQIQENKNKQQIPNFSYQNNSNTNKIVNQNLRIEEKAKSNDNNINLNNNNNQNNQNNSLNNSQTSLKRKLAFHNRCLSNDSQGNSSKFLQQSQNSNANNSKINQNNQNNQNNPINQNNQNNSPFNQNSQNFNENKNGNYQTENFNTEEQQNNFLNESGQEQSEDQNLDNKNNLKNILYEIKSQGTVRKLSENEEEQDEQVSLIRSLVQTPNKEEKLDVSQEFEIETSHKGQFITDEIDKQENLKNQKLQQSFNYSNLEYAAQDGFNNMEEIGQIQDVQPIRTACFSKDGELLILGTNSKSLKIYSTRSIFEKNEQYNDVSEKIQLIWEKKNHHPGSIYTIDISSSGRLIASGSNDKMIKILQVPQYSDDNQQYYWTSQDVLEEKLQGHRGIVRSILFSKDEKHLYSAGTIDQHIKVWDVNKGQVVRTLEGHKDSIYSIKIGGDGSYIASVGMDKKIMIWDLLSNKPSMSINTQNYADMNYIALSENQNYYNLKNIFKDRKKSVKRFSNDKSVVVAHVDGLITHFSLHTQKLIQEINLHQSDCRSVEFDPTSNYIVSSSFDCSVCVYDIVNKKIEARISNHKDRVVYSCFHPFYPLVVSTSADSTAKIFAPKSFIQNQIKNQK